MFRNKLDKMDNEGYVNRPKEEYLSDLLFKFKNDTKRLTEVRKLDNTLKNFNIHE